MLQASKKMQMAMETESAVMRWNNNIAIHGSQRRNFCI